MIYKVETTPDAYVDLVRLKRSDPALHRKAIALMRELEHDPRSGLGHPKPLGGDRVGQWSRHISHRHRLVYKIDDRVVTVLVLAAYGHYDDK